MKLHSYTMIYLFFLEIISFHMINSSTEISKIDNVLSAFQEVAYSYYMRGKYIQNNSMKKGIFSPEDATSQNINYLVCSQFVLNVYKELLNITLPEKTIEGETKDLGIKGIDMFY